MAGTVTWAAPGRVNLIGEHTDYNDGWVLPIALDLRVIATVSLAPEFEFVAEVASGRRYVEAVLAALRAEGYDVPGLRVEVTGNVPLGAGLSSSAALECAVIAATDDLLGLGFSRGEMARIARRAENEFVGVPSGIMDQSASLLGRPGHALLLDCRRLATAQIPFDPSAAGLRLVVIDTRVRHDLADGQYAVRRQECVDAASALGVPALRDATTADVVRLSDPVLRKRARHVVSENDRVHQVVAALRGGDWDTVGVALVDSHLSLRDDFEVSCAELDLAVDTALDAGAIGARMTGGGFGGSALALLPDGVDVEGPLGTAFAERGFAAPTCRGVAASGGATRLNGHVGH